MLTRRFCTAAPLTVARSLAEALRKKAEPLVLDLTASEDLQCRNLLCEKVGEPCICRLSHVLESLADVRQLRLGGNRLTDLPPAVWRLRSLTHLNLSSNRLRSIPPDIAGLTSLQELDLQGNAELQPLPPAALQLPRLQAVRLPERLCTPEPAAQQTAPSQAPKQQR